MKCPFCKAELDLKKDTDALKCPYCDNSFTLADLTRMRIDKLAGSVCVGDTDADGDGKYDSALETDGLESLDSQSIYAKAELALAIENYPALSLYANELIRRDPTRPEAYLYRLLASQRIPRKEDLAKAVPFDSDDSYRFIVKFADAPLRREIESYAEEARKKQEEAEIEATYEAAMEKYRLSRSPNVFYDAARLFDSIGDYKNSREMAKMCRMSAEKIKSRERFRKILKAAVPITLILAIVLTVVIVVVNKKRAHDIENIGIELVSIEGRYSEPDTAYGKTEYYVFFDFKLTNSTGADIELVEVVTSFYDTDGRFRGTLTSTFGTYSSPMELTVGKSEMRETYISTKYPENDAFFELLYYSDITDFTVSHKIVSVEFADGEYFYAE